VFLCVWCVCVLRARALTHTFPVLTQTSASERKLYTSPTLPRSAVKRCEVFLCVYVCVCATSTRTHSHAFCLNTDFCERKKALHFTHTAKKCSEEV
jgi:hypothetical protein